MSEGYRAIGFGAMKNKNFGHVDLMHIIESMCRRQEFRTLYEEDIRDACQRLAKDNAIPISYLFSGNVPTPALGYERTRDFCVNKLDVCEEDKILVKNFRDLARKDKRCCLCHVVTYDFIGILKRYHSVNRNIWFRAMDSLCSTIAIRYPNQMGSRVEEICDEITEDDEKISEIVNDVLFLYEEDDIKFATSLRDSFCNVFCDSSSNDEMNCMKDMSPWWWFRTSSHINDDSTITDQCDDDGNDE